MPRTRKLTPRARAGRKVRGRAPAPEGVAAARRAREARRLEADVVAAADQVLGADPPEEGALERVALLARCPVEAVRAVFGSPGGLHAAVLQAHLEELDDAIRRAVRATRTTRQALEAIVATRAAAAARRPSFARLLDAAPDGEGDPPPDVRRVHRRLAARARLVFVEGIRVGELSPELPPDVLSPMFDAALRAWLVERVAKDGEEPTAEQVAAFVAAVLGGVARRRRVRRR